MKTRLIAVVFIAAFILSGCQSEQSLTRFDETYLDVFDTVTVISGYAADREEFNREAERIHDELLAYHRLCDIYNEYDGLVNIKSINDNAGGEPMAVDPRLFELISFSSDICELTSGKVDITLGAVLSIWHEAREYGVEKPSEAYVPDISALSEAKTHTGFDKLELNAETLTVRLTDPDARLDVGAVAKGYAVQRVAESAPEGYLLSVGGNVSATGAKPDGSAWVVAIQNPDGGYLDTVNVTRGSVVTSGDYQRYYEAEGVRYSHIIDPETLFPGTKWRAVTVLCEDSALADGLSTALFLMDKEEGEALIKSCEAEALWVYADGTVETTEGF